MNNIKIIVKGKLYNYDNVFKSLIFQKYKYKKIYVIIEEEDLNKLEQLIITYIDIEFITLNNYNEDIIINSNNNDYILLTNYDYIYDNNFLSICLENKEDIILIYEKIKNNNINELFIKKIKIYKFFKNIIFKSNIYFNIKSYIYKINYYLIKKNNLFYKIIKNKNLYEYNFPTKIPKILHFYWDESSYCYLSNLCFKTVVFHNPNWKIIIHIPKIKYTQKIIWEKQESIPPHSFEYKSTNFFNIEELKNLGIEINYIDFYDIGITNNIPEILKSDMFRYHILSTMGGVWSDSDILFTDFIEKTKFNYECININDIDTVVSQYNRNLDNNLKIYFYYIGFLLSSANNLFYKTLFENSLKEINLENYQGVGGDMIKKMFGNSYLNIGKKIKNICVANLDSCSIYYFWWGQLKEMFEYETELDTIFELNYNSTHSLIGYHWFRGVQLSKIYSCYYNNENKIQNYDFKGHVPQLVEYYKKIFNDHEMITKEYKISIIMGYVNRIKQLENTIITISKSKHKNYELIIINDGDENDDISFLIEKYKEIDIKILFNTDKHINPCMTYNYGFEKATGDIILIQNPECMHIGDLLTTINCTLNKNEYLVFNCFYLDNYNNNDKLNNVVFNKDTDNKNFWGNEKIGKIIDFTLNNIGNSFNDDRKGWCSHFVYNKTKLHFASAIFKCDLEKIGYFSDNYKDGICFDDDDFVRKIEFNNLKILYYPISLSPYEYPSLPKHSIFVIHQHHDRFDYNDKDIISKWNNNKNIFIRQHEKYINLYIDNYIIGKNIINNHYSFGNLNISYDNFYNKYIITFLKNNNYFILNYIIDKNIINYNANANNIIFKNDINSILKNSIFEFTCDIENIDKVYIKNDIIQEIYVTDNKINIDIVFKNLINDTGIMFINLNNCIIKNPKLILKKNNYNNNSYISENNNFWKYKNIPKIAFTYWFGKLSKLHYISIKSFYDLNPDWTIKIYVPKYPHNLVPMWESEENSSIYNGYDYFNDIKILDFIEIIEIDFTDINFKNDINEIYKSDYLRLYILSTDGGVWFDTDIIFTNPINKYNFDIYCVNGKVEEMDTLISFDNIENLYYIGFLMSSGNNSFYKYLFDNINSIDNKNYQKYGSEVYKKTFPLISDILNKFPNINLFNIGLNTVYPIDWCQTPLLFSDNNYNCKYYYHEHHKITNINNLINSLKNDFIGIHWFNGCNLSKKFIIDEKYNNEYYGINYIIKSFKL